MKAYDGAKPSVGRIVHFNKRMKNYAAIITAVSSETTVDLVAFGLDGFASTAIYDVDFSEDPSKEYHWTWPPRV